MCGEIILLRVASNGFIICEFPCNVSFVHILIFKVHCTIRLIWETIGRINVRNIIRNSFFLHSLSLQLNVLPLCFASPSLLSSGIVIQTILCFKNGPGRARVPKGCQRRCINGVFSDSSSLLCGTVSTLQAPIAILREALVKQRGTPNLTSPRKYNHFFARVR